MNARPTINDLMEAYAADAVDHAQTAFGVSLDYSAESIREVEVVLGKLHASLPRGLMRYIRRAPSAETIETLCKMYGGYIGEVYRRTVGGTWELREDIPGSEGPVLTVSSAGGNSIFPPAKVWNRIHNGAEDDVWLYFQLVTKRPGDVE